MINDEILIKLQESLQSSGMKDNQGKPISKYAFLKKKHIKRLRWTRSYVLSDGRLFHVRVFK